MEKLIGQQLIVGLSGESLTDGEARFIVENNIGGVILFERNLKSIEQIYQLIDEIQGLRHRMIKPFPLFISIDMEGGRVHRLKSPFTFWPPLKNLGEIGSPSMAFQFAHKMGQELKAIGFNLNYAPCVDVLTNPENKVIGDRSLASEPGVVSKLATALVRGYIKSEVLCCVKHFPGHGATPVDSHHQLPVDQRSLKDIENDGDIAPYKKAFQSRVDLLMTAHIHYPNIDPRFPVTLSPFFIKKFLRQALGFRGLVITDDLNMKAVSENFDQNEIPILALKAGANILLYCNEFSASVRAVENLKKAVKDGLIGEDLIRKNLEMIQNLKMAKLKKLENPLSLEEAKKIIGNENHREFARAVAEHNFD